MQRNRGKRIRKTRDLFKKISDTKGTFHAKMGSIKDRNGMDLTEAEDIKNRWQEYTEELYKKDLHDPDNHDGVINKADIDFFLKLSCFFYDPVDFGNFISGSSAFSETSLNIWKFTVHILLKPGLENFEHYFTSM